MKTNISPQLLGIMGLIGSIIPISQLIRSYFSLPADSFFGSVLPLTAAVAVVCILIYAFVRERLSK